MYCTFTFAHTGKLFIILYLYNTLIIAVPRNHRRDKQKNSFDSTCCFPYGAVSFNKFNNA